MDQILEMFAFKTTEIQNNLLDLMSTIVEYENSKRNEQQIDVKSFDNQILIKKSVFETIRGLIPKINKNLKSLSDAVDRNIAENERLTQEIANHRKRESISERQLKEVRNLYHNLKEEMEWKEICDQVLETEIQRNNSPNQEFIKSHNYLKTCLALICSSAQNQRTVQSFMENQEVFREFFTTIRTILEDQIKAFVTNDNNISFDPNLIETICSISINIFKCNDYLGEDIPEWINCFTALHSMDKRFLKSSINGLNFICFAPNGTEELQKKAGIITLLAKCLIDSEMKLEFNLKTNAVKVIRRMIDNSKDHEMGLKQFNEFTVLIPMERFRQMVGSEVFIQLKKAFAGLLCSLSSYTHSITED